MDTNYEPIFDNVFESVCEEVAEPCETNQDNLPTLAEIFEIRGQKMFYEKIVDTKFVSSLERQKMVDCVCHFLYDHYNSLKIPTKTLKYYAQELSKISQDSEEEYFCYWKSTRIRGGKVFEHRKPIGKLYKRRKYKIGKQTPFDTKQNATITEMNDSGKNIAEQKKELDSIIPMLCNKSIIVDLFRLTYPLRNIIRCTGEGCGPKLIEEYESLFFFDGILINEELQMMYPHFINLDEDIKINELINKCKNYFSNTDDDDDDFFRLFIFLKTKLINKSPINTRNKFMDNICIYFEDKYDGMFFNVPINEDLIAISKKINEHYRFPSILKQNNDYFLTYCNKIIKMESFKKCLILLLKLSLILNLKIPIPNANIISFLNLVIFNIKKTMMTQKIATFCDSIGLDRKKLLNESYPELIFTAKSLKL
ncbi:hypothetical protein DERP_000734 [Dermatophagoides pteronyssinus]|uniref:Uncharacterized protein n=1 Tax=Dermatophagoides pteronyssinus TaxID=6956 RepID=A0ABQ8J1J1_DERPT|nr:hypothetical protein DERP_000734 [Dermatophagoides pteronyssinus]